MWILEQAITWPAAAPWQCRNCSLCHTPARARYGRETAAVTSQGPNPALTQPVMQLVHISSTLKLFFPSGLQDVWFLQHEKKPLPCTLVRKNTRFPHLEGGLWIQIFDSSFRSPVLNTRWHVIGPYQKHKLIGKTKKKKKAQKNPNPKVEPLRTGKNNPKILAHIRSMFVGVENIENYVFNQNNSNWILLSGKRQK